MTLFPPFSQQHVHLRIYLDYRCLYQHFSGWLLVAETFLLLPHDIPLMVIGVHTRISIIIMWNDMSFWNKFHRRGPKDEPCWQPSNILFRSLVTSFIFTLLSLLSKYDLRRLREFCPKPKAWSFFTIREWQRESKALLISVDVSLIRSIHELNAKVAKCSLTLLLYKS